MPRGRPRIILPAMSKRSRRVCALALATFAGGLLPTLLERSAQAGDVRIRLRIDARGDKKDIIKKQLVPWKSQLAYCYGDMDEEKLRFQHRMTVTGKVDDGAALADAVIENKVEDEYVQECLDFTISTMRFDSLEGEAISFQIRFNQH